MLLINGKENKDGNSSTLTSIELRDKLIEEFKLLDPKKRIIIFLDSIDQLVSNDYDLKWMTYDFPSNVKIVFSTLQDHGDILDCIRSKIKNEDNYLLIDPLNTSNVKTILEDWLSKANRSLSNQQWSILDNLFSRATLQPLFIKLVFDLIIKWRSFYEPVDDFKGLLSIDSCIQYLFKQLEKEHGKSLFSTCLFYMSALKNGISESELEDILSLDDDLLQNVFEFHSPPIRRFPIALWARIKHVLKEYLVEKEIDDTKVIFW